MNFKPINEYETVELPIDRHFHSNQEYFKKKFQQIEKRTLLSLKLIKYIGKGGYGSVNI